MNFPGGAVLSDDLCAQFGCIGSEVEKAALDVALDVVPPLTYDQLSYRFYPLDGPTSNGR